jgi:ParB family chromosome partitioning protein
MSTKLSKKPSPILGVTGAMIDDESDHLIGDSDRFSHSFTVSISAIEPDPDQPRRHFDKAALEDMAATFKAVGLLQPILLRKHPDARRRWIIVAGERRWRAAQLAGWTEITAIETTSNVTETALIENLQRSDLTVMEEARALQKMMLSQGWSQERCANALGIDASRVSSALNVLSLPEDFLDEVEAGAVAVPRNLLVELARIKEAPLRDRMIELAREGDLTIRLLRSARKEGKDVETNKANDEARERKPRSAVGLKASRLTQFLSSLDVVHSGTYQPTKDEMEKLLAIKHAIDRILAVKSGTANEQMARPIFRDS